MNRRWTDDACEKALEMKASGMSWAEIADSFGETYRALFAAVERYQKRLDGIPHPIKDTRPIGQCSEWRAYENDAKVGSAKLLAEIERVFGRAA